MIECLENLVRVVDCIFVYVVVYRLLRWAQGTHSAALLRGLLGIFLFYALSHVIGLKMVYWSLEKLTPFFIIFVIIIFQPELRRFLERLGTPGPLFSPLLAKHDIHSTMAIKSILRAVEILSKEKVGALIVIEVSTNLTEYIGSGIAIRSVISADLLASLFWPGSPTHDGAVILRMDRIEAAGCLLPLTDTPIADRRLGTRHRAAIGITELTDALVIVVSEETGVISLTENGSLMRYLTKEALETRLFNLYKEEKVERPAPFSILRWLRLKE